MCPNNTRLDAAKEYLGRGFSVIPVDRKTKKPLIPWKEFQNRHPTEEEIQSWFEKWPNANIAIITGSISGNLYVVDGDGEEGVKWIRDNFPVSSAEVVSGRDGGRHFYYKAPEGVTVKNQVNVVHQVDIRGEGGYIIAPPSIHANGRQYKWEFTEGLGGLENWK